jgi:hypothetical protein
VAAWDDWQDWLGQNSDWGNPAAAQPAPAKTVSSPTWEGLNASTPQGGHSEADILAAALAYGQPRNLSPVYLKDNGQFVNGGYQVKFRDNNLGGVSTTEFIPMAGFSGYSLGGGGGGGGGAASGVFDPILSQLKSDLSAQGVADLASRDAASRRAIGLFGDPNLNLGEASKTLGFDLGAIIDPQTQQLAKQSYESGVGTQARIDKANKDALRQIKRALAARGALRSGELGHQLKEQEGRYTNAQFDARQALLDMLSGYQKGYLEGERLRQSNYFQALMGAAGRAQYGGGGGGGVGGSTGRSGAAVPTQFPLGPGDTELEGFDSFGSYPDQLRIDTVKNYFSGGDPYDPRRIQGGPQF